MAGDTLQPAYAPGWITL